MIVPWAGKVECVLMNRRLVPALTLVSVCTCAFTQQVRTNANAPRIIILLPHDIRPEVVWVRYALYGPEGTGGRISEGDTLRAEPNFTHSIPAVFDGSPARYAKIVIYAPRCKFAIYDLDLGSGSDISQQFQCEPLGTKAIHSFLSPKEIPSNTYLIEKRLDVAAYLDGLWVCRFLLQMPRSSRPQIEAGSCLGSEIPLGTVGEIDPGRGGRFDMTIPDFTHDPVFDKFEQRGKFGVIELVLKEKKIGRVLATIKPENPSELGLNVQPAYHEPVIFTRVH